MNRVYQGRVHSVTLLDPDGEPESSFTASELTDQSSSLLWQHHCIFQDAINYYLLALGALADPEALAGSRMLADLRSRLSAAWETFPRRDAAAAAARSLRDSLTPWLLLPKDASIDTAFAAVLAGNTASGEARALALALLLEKCKGESGVQQNGRGYFPRFCVEDTKPSWDFSTRALAAARGKDELAAILHAPDASLKDLHAVASKMDLSWTVKTDPEKFFKGDEAIKRLNKALDNLEERLKNPDKRLAEALTDISAPTDQIAEMRAALADLPDDYSIPRNRKATPDLTFATIAFITFPNALTAAFLRLSVGKPKGKKTTTGAIDYGAAGDDPIKLSRGERGYVFPAFTSLTAWNAGALGSPAWKEFDIAAFKEALKSLNQFNQKTEERDAKSHQTEGELAHILGGELKDWKPTSESEEENAAPPSAIDPKLFALGRKLEEVLTLDLSETVVDPEPRQLQFGTASFSYRLGEWHISHASLRGFRDIGEQWRDLYRKADGQPKTAQLLEAVTAYQRNEKYKKSIGSVPLFRTLCEERFWPLWAPLDTAADEDGDDAGEGSTEENRTLRAMAEFHLKVRDFQRQQEPINLTPAEPRHSRRLYMFSDVRNKEAKVIFRSKDPENPSLECGIAHTLPDRSVELRRLSVRYTAPRLRRDHLLSASGSEWLQPMMEALGIKRPDDDESKKDESSFFSSAVSLMPDFMRSEPGRDYSELRFLLNFPKTIDETWLHKALGKSARFRNRFNGTKEKDLHLNWEGTTSSKIKSDALFHDDPEICKNGFTTLSIDLGQRTAGAWALLKVTTSNPRTDGSKRPVRILGTNGKNTWYAEVQRHGLLRLPGEDKKVQTKDGDFITEHSGSAGRNASEEEYDAACKFATEHLAAENAKNWLGESPTDRSYPEQNDALIALANRRLSRLATYHRWSCFDPDRPELAHRRDKLVETLLEELQHWKAAYVGEWRALVEAGDFAKFRTCAGEAFARYRQQLGEALTTLANRVAPLRGRSWQWHGRPAKKDMPRYGELRDTGPAPAQTPFLRGQRGLSMSRLEQLERLRVLFLRYNRSFDREAGVPAKFGRADLGRESGEPCALILAKLERMKNERINQTAHDITALALGVRLTRHKKDREVRQANDIHGEYERIPGREVADLVVIEDLNRYLTSQGRAPSENSRLMKWSHRSVRDKLKMICAEAYGIPVVEAPAAYSSRFSAVDAAPGSRCEERPFLDNFSRDLLMRRASAANRPGAPHPYDSAALLAQFDRLAEENRKRRGAKKPLFTLLYPRVGGTLFTALGHTQVVQADVNAAINVGLRALAAPDQIDILHKVRSYRKDDRLFAGKALTKQRNAREKAAFANKPEIILEGEASKKLARASAPNFFADPHGIASFDKASAEISGEKCQLASGVGLWGTVNERFLSHLVQLNNLRLVKYKLEPVDIISTSETLQNSAPNDDDQIPM